MASSLLQLKKPDESIEKSTNSLIYKEDSCYAYLLRGLAYKMKQDTTSAQRELYDSLANSKNESQRLKQFIRTTFDKLQDKEDLDCLYFADLNIVSPAAA